MDIDDVKNMILKKYGNYKNYTNFYNDNEPVGYNIGSNITFTDICLSERERITNKLLNKNNYNIFYNVRFAFTQYNIHKDLKTSIDMHIDLRISIDNHSIVPVKTIYLCDRTACKSEINYLFSTIDSIKQMILNLKIKIDNEKYEYITKENISDVLSYMLNNNNFCDYKNYINLISQNIKEV